MKLSHTYLSGLTLRHIQAWDVTEEKKVNFWRHLDRDGVAVGPHYPTLTEAMADTHDYAIRAGWMK